MARRTERSSHLFVIPDLSVGELQLPEEEARHALQVLRAECGDSIMVADGSGQQGSAEVIDLGKRSVTIKVNEVSKTPRERDAPIHVAIAPTKSIDRYEWFLEKATEIGIDRITPILTQHSERKRVRHDRSMKMLIAAMKQSQRYWLPQLDELMPLNDLLEQDLPDQKAFGWCAGEHRPLMDWYDQKPSLVLIGPEGDFGNEEAETLIKKGFDPVSIGSTRLRTETAAVAAVTWMGLVQQS